MQVFAGERQLSPRHGFPVLVRRLAIHERPRRPESSRWSMVQLMRRQERKFSMSVGSLPRLAMTMALTVMSSILLTACAAASMTKEECADGSRELRLGFYAHFAPVSYSADGRSGSAGFDIHRGYEADLLTALEAMDGVGVSFSRRGIGAWDEIWLKSSGSDFDVIGGGITILESRTLDSEGRERVVFTSGHIAFRQSLLVRAGDRDRFTGYEDLTGDVRVGVLSGTTGEARLLEITGLTDSDGVLASGVEVITARGPVIADGSADYFITAAAESNSLAGRRHLRPPSDEMPQVIYLGDELGEMELLSALSDGGIDALARGEIGNLDAVHTFGDAFTVAFLDDAVEYGGFTIGVADAGLATCLGNRIDYLTDDMSIGYVQWARDPMVFMSRAEMWNRQ